MSSDYREFLKLLNCHRVKYVIVGAHAVVAHSRPRATGDLDVLIDTSKKNAGKIVCSITRIWIRFCRFKIWTSFCKHGFVIQLGYEPNRIDTITSITEVN